MREKRAIKMRTNPNGNGKIIKKKTKLIKLTRLHPFLNSSSVSGLQLLQIKSICLAAL